MLDGGGSGGGSVDDGLALLMMIWVTGDEDFWPHTDAGRCVMYTLQLGGSDDRSPSGMSMELDDDRAQSTTLDNDEVLAVPSS